MRDIVRELLMFIVIFVAINLVLPRSIVQGSSMEPNLSNGQRLAASPIPYLFGEPQHGDIIMLHPIEPDGPMLVKRIIGLPGDTVAFRNHQLYLNEHPVNEIYLDRPCNWKCNDQTWVLSADEYFVMGDNRNTSYDSRDYGPITSEKIMARVLFRWWPLREMTWFQH